MLSLSACPVGLQLGSLINAGCSLLDDYQLVLASKISNGRLCCLQQLHPQSQIIQCTLMHCVAWHSLAWLYIVSTTTPMIQAFHQALQISASLGTCVWDPMYQESQTFANSQLVKLISTAAPSTHSKRHQLMDNLGPRSCATAQEIYLADNLSCLMTFEPQFYDVQSSGWLQFNLKDSRT